MGQSEHKGGDQGIKEEGNRGTYQPRFSIQEEENTIMSMRLLSRIRILNSEL